MIRSFLFVPADSKRKQSKIQNSAADAIILDLEDSVLPENRPAARKLISSLLTTSLDRIHAPEIWVRINSLTSSDYAEDLAVVVPMNPTGIVLPKSLSIESVRQLSVDLEHIELASGLPAGNIKIIPVVTESAASVLNTWTYQAGHARLAGLTWGAEDLSADLGASEKTNDNGALSDVFRLARSLCLLAAKAAQVPAIEALYSNFRDTDGLIADTICARKAGFFGRLAIHPDQVKVINSAFLPTSEEIKQAKRIVDAFSASANAGVIQLDGVMLDQPHHKAAQNLLSRAKSFERSGE